MINTATKLLVSALNNPWQTWIGDPWKGSYNISIRAEDTEIAEALAEQMREINVEPKVNFKLDDAGSLKRIFVAVYAWESLKALLDNIGDELDEPRRKKLATLVRARGPVHPIVINEIDVLSNHMRMCDELVAVELNKKRFASGMGGRGWTAKKVRKIRLEANRSDAPR